MTDRPDQPHQGAAPLPSPGLLPWAAAADTTVADPHSGNGSAPAAVPGSNGSAALGEDATDADDLDLLESAWTPPRRVNRWTAVLVGGLVAALGFGGGVLAQKNHDAGLVSSSGGAGAAARVFARANGFGGNGSSRGNGTPGAGGAFGQGGAQGGLGGDLPGAGTGSGSGRSGSGPGGSGSGTSSGTPVVVGTVVSVGDGVLVVQNFAGAKVTVKVPAGTPVTTAGLTGLRAGDRVSVTGAKAADGTVTASSVVSRNRG
jgi:hypothetical protein